MDVGSVEAQPCDVAVGRESRRHAGCEFGIANADMSKTDFCDSSGVSALVRVFRHAATSATALRLVLTTPAVLRVLSITGVDRLVDVYPSVAASLADPNGQAHEAWPDAATARADTDGGA